MARILIQLQNPIHWKWKASKKHKPKVKIRGKLKKWIKKNCPGSVYMRQEAPPSVWIDEDKVDEFNKTWV